MTFAIDLIPFFVLKWIMYRSLTGNWIHAAIDKSMSVIYVKS